MSHGNRYRRSWITSITVPENYNKMLPSAIAVASMVRPDIMGKGTFLVIKDMKWRFYFGSDWEGSNPYPPATFQRLTFILNHRG